jgi:hypothetical protein
MISVKNKIYRIHRYLDKKESLKFILLLVLVGTPNLFIFLSTNASQLNIGLVLYIFVGIIDISRMMYVSGSIKFDMSIYNIPEHGELIVITKDFYYNSCGFMPRRSGIYGKTADKISKGQECRFGMVKNDQNEFEVSMTFTGEFRVSYSHDWIWISYFDSIGYWDTKANVREKKLKKIGIKL